MRRIAFASVICCLLACGSDGESSQNGQFEFHEGRAGRVVGLRAVVTADAGEIESQELEVALISTDDAAAFVREPQRSASTQLSRAQVRDLRNPLAVDLPLSASARPQAVCPGGESVDRIATMDGWTCWIGDTVAVGSFGREDAVEDKLLFAPDGIYRMVGTASNIYVPPDFIKASWQTGVGCIYSPGGDTITKDYLGALASLAVSFGVGVYSAGFTGFILPGEGFQRGIQYDTGFGISVSILPFPFGLGMSITDTSQILSGFTPTAGFDVACLEPVMPFSEDEQWKFRNGHLNPFATIADGLESMRQPSGDPYRDALTEDMARNVAPIFEAMSQPSGAGPAQHITAATNADLFAAWFARDGAQLCDDCPNTSIDDLITGYGDRVEAAGSDTAAIVAAGEWGAVRHTQTMPQLMMHSALSLRAGVGAELARVLAEDRAETDDPNRFVAREIVRVEGQVAEVVDLSITAEEIASLVGTTPEAIEGAQVTVGAEPRVGAGTVAVEGGIASAGYTPEQAGELLFRVEVDLTTAAGPFDGDVAQWVVRPAIRRVGILAGPPTQVLLSSAPRITSGGPLTLTAMLLDERNNLVEAPFAVRFVDGEGETIAQSDGSGGITTHQFIPEPSTPAMDEVRPATLQLADGSTIPGFELTGRGFSQEATVKVDGETLDDRGVAWSVASSGSVLFAAEGIEPGSHRLELENPEGIQAEAITFDGP